ncbi:MAG: glycosyltransferase family 4 protein [Acidobacteriota bacterium]
MTQPDPLKIFQILDKHEFNTGSVHQMFQAAAGLRERGHMVTIVSREDSLLAARAGESGVEFVSAPFSGEADLETVRIVRNLVKTRRPDVIHVHKGRPHTLALAGTWTDPVPAFIVNRGVSFPLTIWNRPKYRTARVDRIVCVCEQIRQVVIRTGKLPAAKVVVVYAGTDTGLFSPGSWDGGEFRREKGIPQESFLITQVGVRDWKGWRELVDAAAELRHMHPRIHVALIGCKDESDKAEIRRYAEGKGIGEAVTPVEVRDDMPSVFASSDCVTDASWAGTGITGTIREAMAMGKPTVSTDCGGNIELVSSPEVGWLIRPKDQRALVDALRAVIDDPVQAKGVGEKAMERVRNGFSKEHRLDSLEHLYREVIAGKR